MENNDNGLNFDALKEQATQDEKIAAKLLDIVKGTEVGKNYSSTIAHNYFDENITSEHRKIYDAIDNTLLSAGIEKPEERIKTSEWVALIAKQNKELQSKLSELSKTDNTQSENDSQLSELQAKFKSEREQLISEAQKQLNEKEARIKELEQGVINNTRRSEISKALTGLEFNKNLDKTVIDEILSVKVDKLLQNAKTEDGKTVWCKPDGTPYKNGILNANLEDVLQSELSSIIHKQTAGGGATKEGQKATFNGSQIFIPENSFSTQEQFYNEFSKVAQSKGIAKGEQFDKLYWEAFERYGVKSLREF